MDRQQQYVKFLSEHYKNLTKDQIKDIVDMLQSIVRRTISSYMKTRKGEENYGTIQ